MKDYFSEQSKVYAAFRPTYPAELYDFIMNHVQAKNRAWDCATGNGQVAQHLSKNFREVFATDISHQQLAQAVPSANIAYTVATAEETSFPSDQFDLITVAQALHWFDHTRFYKEAIRVGKQGCLLAVWGYSLIDITPQINERIQSFYHDVIGPYWDNARKHVENEYNDIPFPFREIPAPPLAIRLQWTIDQLSGYFLSWSSTQQFIRDKGFDPVPGLIASVKHHWAQPTMNVSFPIFLKAGKIGG
jgi:SAM-dependent methyltransferase